MRIVVNKIEAITQSQIRKDLPEFQVGDTLNIGCKIIEKKKERIQNFEGIVIARKGQGISETFTVRSTKYGVGVERTFPLNSPNIATITVVKKGKVRRAKLYFLRERKSQYKIKERR